MNRNLSKPLRTAYYAALSGPLSLSGVKVFDSWQAAEGFRSNHVIIGRIGESNQNTADTFISRVTVEIQAVTVQTNGFSSEDSEELEDTILQILIPTVKTHSITMTGFQVSDVRKEGSQAVNEVGVNGGIARRIITISQLINKQ